MAWNEVAYLVERLDADRLPDDTAPSGRNKVYPYSEVYDARGRIIIPQTLSAGPPIRVYWGHRFRDRYQVWRREAARGGQAGEIWLVERWTRPSMFRIVARYRSGNAARRVYSSLLVLCYDLADIEAPHNTPLADLVALAGAARKQT